MATSSIGPGAMMNAQIGVQQAQETALLQQAQSAIGPGQTEKIKKVAREFEAILLQGWLQQTEQSLATVPGSDDDPDSEGQDTMTSLGVQALSGAMAASGGIGLGPMIEKAMLSMAQKLHSTEQNPPKNKSSR